MQISFKVEIPLALLLCLKSGALYFMLKSEALYFIAEVVHTKNSEI